MKNAGLNAADFSRASNMAESVVSRTLSGKTVPTLNKVDAAARTLGYELTLSPLERVTVRVIGTAMSDLVQSIQQYSGTEEQWTRVSAGMRNLMEFPDDEPADFKKVTIRGWTCVGRPLWLGSMTISTGVKGTYPLNR